MSFIVQPCVGRFWKYHIICSMPSQRRPQTGEISNLGLALCSLVTPDFVLVGSGNACVVVTL